MCEIVNPIQAGGAPPSRFILNNFFVLLYWTFLLSSFLYYPIWHIWAKFDDHIRCGPLVIGHSSEPPEISHTKPCKIEKKVIYSKIQMSYPHNLIFGSKGLYIKVIDFIKFYHVTNPFFSIFPITSFLGKRP